MLDRRLVEDVAAELGASPGLIEKDWQVVRALGVISTTEREGMLPAFSGGTSLSKGWGLIKRFSEDIDFKVSEPAPPSASAGRRARGDYRMRLLKALTTAGFVLEGKIEAGNDSRYFAAALGYEAVFPAGQGLRPHIRIEFSFRGPARTPIVRPIRSLIAAAQDADPEVAAFPCVDVIETAADKLSALAWRVRTRQRGGARDDPTIIRHLHDLAALEPTIASAGEFRALVMAALAADRGRGGEVNPPNDPAVIFTDMLERLRSDPLWAREYEEFVAAVSFAGDHERITFERALAATQNLTSRLL